MKSLRVHQVLVFLPLFVVQSIAATGDLYVTNQADKAVNVYTPAAVMSTFASGFSDPIPLAFDRFGNLYVGDSSSSAGVVWKLTADGTKTLFSSGFGPIVALAFDTSNNLYVEESSAPGSNGARISKITPSGSTSTFAADLQSPTYMNMAFDGDGDLFVSTNFGIIRIKPDSTKSVFAGTGSQGGIDNSPLVFDRAGNLYGVLHSQAPISIAIVRFDPSGARSVFSDGWQSDPQSFAFDNVGNLFTTALSGGFSDASSTIYKVTPDGTTMVFFTHPSRFAEYLAFEDALLPIPARPRISLSRSGLQLTITFSGVLQQSGDVLQWQDMQPQPASPFTFTPSGVRNFYRSRQSNP